MTQATPDREWWTAEALAAAGLPDVPTSQKGVDLLAKRLDWRAHPTYARRRAGRGGGWEYHWKLLPVRAQAALLKAANAPHHAPAPQRARGEVWSWYDGLPEAVKAQAAARLAVIQKVEALEAPMGKALAVDTVAAEADVAARTIWNWFEMIEGVDPADRLAYLAPRHRAAEAKRERAECSQEFLDWLKADYLRVDGGSFKACYDRVKALCKTRGLKVLADRTARRWMDANVPRVTQVYAREGLKGLEKCFPPQIRDRSTMVALEGVNADCHKIDVFVQWPGIDKPVRPQIVAFQDLYSNKILSWRVDLDPNKVAVMSAFGELIETWGIPRHCLFDNGHEFANKWLTGGTPTRFRFTVRDDDALGVLPQMGIQVHWATPAHGQAKPIERAFRDIADRLARHPAFAGAYVGNKPTAKPENYGSRAIPLADFLAITAQEIADHNARPGRLTPNAKGRSFDDTFAESYGTAPIRKATPEQHRLWLMGQEVCTLHRTHGALALFKNSYWADWMNEFAGQKVVARFDPENLHAGLWIYTLAGEFLGEAECREKVGFFDLVGARLHAKAKAQRRRAEKELLKAQLPVSVEALVAELATVPAPETPLIEAKVVDIAPVRHRKVMTMERSLPVPDTSRDAELRVLQVDFTAPRPAAEPEETDVTRFWRVIDIERRSEAGEPISAEDADFYERMQRHPIYRAQRAMFDRDGDAAIG
ncbi:transposase domain-containing protein [Rhodobacter capsulatus]|uniref:transposase domain-containing protein n=1 Tax=Rhodobacter capsulatus TaxID=1061 RepID=UPI0003D2B84C|nr:transposase domain-containing protein [Rhodobacter capsulatus]ETD85723.1 integrase [Rhodobacter capsulatus YW1]